MAEPSLKVIVDHRVVRQLSLADELTVGRRSDNGLVLEDPAVSGRHGRFHRVAGCWTYTDEGSSHGSLVAAGPRLVAGQAVTLDDVTQILVGDTVLEFDPEASDTPSVAPPGPGAGERSTVTPGWSAATSASNSTERPAATSTANSTESASPAATSTASSTESASPAATSTDTPPRGQEGADTTAVGAVIDTHRIEGLPERAQGGSARLLVVLDDQTRSVDLDRDETVLGRSSRCDVVIDHASVSARHAVIRREGQAYVVEDLGSTNGTRLGLVRLTGPQELSPNTHLILGSADLLFLHDAPGGQRPLDPQAFLRWLRTRRKVTRQQLRRTMDQHLVTGRSVEELLVSEGVLRPGELTELRHNAAAGLASGAGASRSTALWLWIAAALVAAALTLLVLG